MGGFAWLWSRSARRRGATLLEYALLTIIITTTMGTVFKRFTPNIFTAAMNRFKLYFANYPPMP